MKKTIYIKKITFLFILVLLFSGPISAQTKLIMVIDTTQKQILSPDGIVNPDILAEQVTMDIFLEDGYEVEIFHTNDGDAALSTKGQSAIDILNEADIIIIGRRVPSLSFDSPDKELWNGLYPPIMTSNQWALRSSRMNWFNSEDIYANTTIEDSALVYATIEDPDDEVFDDLEELFDDLVITENIAWWYGSHNIMNPGDVGNGTVMATAAEGRPIWVRFEDGDEFYTGSIDIPAGERVYFGLGCERDNLYQYYSRYTEVSKEIFLREAARLSGHKRGDEEPDDTSGIEIPDFVENPE
ncbi:MAG: hypothetical protein JXB17_12015, partial [Bacteroidales bacterium]|nr:hypothetical protein [Bacteroidales bacterium]